jgi:hypothetical protein
MKPMRNKYLMSGIVALACFVSQLSHADPELLQVDINKNGEAKGNSAMRFSRQTNPIFQLTFLRYKPFYP